MLSAILPKIDETTAASRYDGKLSIHEIEELYLSFLVDITAQANRYIKTRVLIYYYVPSLRDMLASLFHGPIEFRLISPKDNGLLFSSTIERIFRNEQCKNLLLLITLHPLVNFHIFEHALQVLNFDDDSLVIGALTDHTPYLLGMKNPHESFLMLEDAQYYSSEALLRRCCAINGLVNPLCSLPVIQTMSDLMVLKERMERLCETRHDYPKRSLSLLRQLESTHTIERPV